MRSPLFYQPPKEKGPRQKSIFEMVVPKRDAAGNIIEDTEVPEEEENLSLGKRILMNRWFRILLLALAAALFMYIGYTYFGMGRSKGYTLSKENAARIVVFPHCTYELLESDVSSYPGVIGAVAAYDANGNLSGYAYDLYCEGEGGRVLFTMGISTEGSITGVSITSHKELQGLGTSAGNLFIGSFAGLAATEEALDTITYMYSTPRTSEAIVTAAKNAVRHAHDLYGIVGKADEELHESVSNDIAANNTYDSEELRALLPGATFTAYYPAKGYPLKGFNNVTMTYYVDLNGEQYYAADMTVQGVDGEISLSVALTSDRKIAGIRVHDQHESTFDGNTVLDSLLTDMVGCDFAALDSISINDASATSCYTIINAAIDAMDCIKKYLIQ